MRKYRIIVSVLICLNIVTIAISSLLVKKSNAGEKYCAINNIEAVLEDEEILNLAEVVVKGTQIEKKDEIIYNNNGICATIGIYSFKTEECYLGNIQSGDEIFFSYGGSFLPEELNCEGEKIIYLKKNILQYEDQDVYSFVSVSQGVFTEEAQMKNELGYSFDVMEVREKNASR